MERIKLYHNNFEIEEMTYQLKYILLEQAAENGKVYGVSIEKVDVMGHQEKDSVIGLCENRERAKQLLKTMAEGAVFPIHLASICDDFLSTEEING